MMLIIKKLHLILLLIAGMGCSHDKVEHAVPNPPRDTTATQPPPVPQDEFDKRVSVAFLVESKKPLIRVPIKPPLKPGRAPYCREYSFSLMEYVTRCFWLDENIGAANDAVLEYANYFLDHKDAIYDGDDYRWSAEVSFRLIELFGTKGTKHAGLLTNTAEKAILEVGWLYSKRDPSAQNYYTAMSSPDYQVSNTWYILGSENHHAQDFAVQWHFAKLAKDDPNFRDRLYYNGHNAAYYFEQWQTYLKMYFVERAKKGLLVEMMSPTYNLAALKGMFNVYDFAEDPLLKKRVRYYLDLYFTYWAEEQLDGISGGGKARIYTHNDLAQGTFDYGYYFFGLGDRPKRISSEKLSAMTSSYRPPEVVADIARDVQGRGVYEVIQRPLGLAVPGHSSPPYYHLRTDSGGIVRYSYCTPDFIMGSAMCEARPMNNWTNISSQNRSNGVIFSADHTACIIPQCEKRDGHADYNAQWVVQHKGTMISQKLTTGSAAGNMEVWFASNGLSTPLEEKGWVFTSAGNAYAAVNVVQGTTKWVDQTNPIISYAHGQWLYCNDAYSPVILEVARSSDYESFQAFRDTIKSRPLTFNNKVLHYTGIYGDAFTFYADYSHVPEINGVSVNYAPDKTFNSPFLKEDWNSGVVTIEKGGQKQVLNFN